MSWWTRWPDEQAGPLWVGLHVVDRASAVAVVGVEVWTEPPERTSAGPDEVVIADNPFPPQNVWQSTLSDLRYAPLMARLREVLGASEDLTTADRERMSNGLRTGGPGKAGLYDRAHYERVAAIHRRAVQSGSRTPVHDVAQHFKVGDSTAFRWLKVARREYGIATAQSRIST